MNNARMAEYRQTDQKAMSICHYIRCTVGFSDRGIKSIAYFHSLHGNKNSLAAVVLQI